MEPQSWQTVRKGDTISFYCDAFDGHAVTWNFDLGPLPPEAYFVNNDYSTLYIRQVKKMHQGYY